MNPQGFGLEGPGDVDTIIETRIQNTHPVKELTIISGEFKDLNNKVLRPKEKLAISFLVPAGYREYIRPTSFKNKEYVYIGLRDKDAADPVIYKPVL
jgi:hypothetical protein